MSVLAVWHDVDVDRSLGSEPCNGTTSKALGGSSTIAISSSTASTDVELSTGSTMGEIASALLPLMDDNGRGGDVDGGDGRVEGGEQLVALLMSL